MPLTPNAASGSDTPIVVDTEQNVYREEVAEREAAESCRHHFCGNTFCTVLLSQFYGATCHRSVTIQDRLHFAGAVLASGQHNRHRLAV